MVRLKCRYILAEIVFADGQTQTNYNANTVMHNIKENVATMFGEEGLSKCAQILQVKYYNPVTSICIIRVGRKNAQTLLNTLIFCTQFELRVCKFRILHVSGTIQKCEIRLKELTQIWMHQYKKLSQPKPIQ